MSLWLTILTKKPYTYPVSTQGTINWHDLTVPNADEVRDFYSAVVGWTYEGLDMGGYEDYVMKSPSGDGVSGICHARGVNAGVPAQWLLYITVANLAESLEKVVANGGEIVYRSNGGTMAVIKDPAGAVCALYAEETNSEVEAA
ncbi:COG3324 Predicted enzyme related to lactoylglutathione lyase [Fimbriimonadaceae bacterium]